MDHHIEEIYAVRKGKEVNNCLFFTWQDAQLQIENPTSEWKRFPSNEIQSAMAFLKRLPLDNPNKELQLQLQPKPKTSSAQDNELVPAEFALAAVPPNAADETTLPPLDAQPILTHDIAGVAPLDRHLYPLSDTPITASNNESIALAMDMNMNINMNMNMNMNDAAIGMDIHNVTELETFPVLPPSESTTNPKSSSSSLHKRKRPQKEQPYCIIVKPPARPWKNM